jgi:hypothetical protein
MVFMALGRTGGTHGSADAGQIRHCYLAERRVAIPQTMVIIRRRFHQAFLKFIGNRSSGPPTARPFHSPRGVRLRTDYAG